MFVTARLINAAGEPVRSDEEKDEVVETVSPPQVAPIELPLMPK
jgi:general secretion pathway protein D